MNDFKVKFNNEQKSKSKSKLVLQMILSFIVLIVVISMIFPNKTEISSTDRKKNIENWNKLTDNQKDSTLNYLISNKKIDNMNDIIDSAVQNIKSSIFTSCIFYDRPIPSTIVDDDSCLVHAFWKAKIRKNDDSYQPINGYVIYQYHPSDKTLSIYRWGMLNN